MEFTEASAVEAGRCDECGAGGLTGTDADAAREAVMITTIEFSRVSLKLCSDCKQKLADELVVERLVKDRVIVMDEAEQLVKDGIIVIDEPPQHVSSPNVEKFFKKHTY